MTNATIPTPRAGQSDTANSTAYALIVLIESHPGSVDRVVGHLRRRRANMQTLVLGRGSDPSQMRISVVVNDSEVGVDHLVAQLRKIVDVTEVQYFALEQAIMREMALIRVAYSPANAREILDLAQQYGASTIDITAETLTLEITGSVDKVERFVELLGAFGIREVAYSGSVAIARGATAANAASEQ